MWRRFNSPYIGALATSVALLVPNMTFAAPQSFSQLATLLVQILTAATSTAIGLVFVLYFFGLATDLHKIGEGEAGKRKEYLIWGIIALFVMISVGGILATLENTLFGSSSSMSGGGIPIGLQN